MQISKIRCLFKTERTKNHYWILSGGDVMACFEKMVKRWKRRKPNRKVEVYLKIYDADLDTTEDLTVEEFLKKYMNYIES